MKPAVNPQLNKIMISVKLAELNNKPDLLEQHVLNNLIRDLGLLKLFAELLASRLKECNLLTAETKVSYYRVREKVSLKFSCSKDNFRILPCYWGPFECSLLQVCMQ